MDSGQIVAAEVGDATALSLLILYVVLALGVSFLCSIAEAVLLSMPVSYVEAMKEKKPKQAAFLVRLKTERLDQALAAILTLNTIAHTTGAIGAGSHAITVFGNAWFGAFSAVMTLAILFLSEIIPKTIGAVYWKNLALPVAWFTQAMVIVLFPVVWISEKLTRVIAHGKQAHVFSRDEFISMARVGEQAGTLDGNESHMIRNLLRFDSLTVKDIMTPRTVIAALRGSLTVGEGLLFTEERSFTRMPVYGENRDDMTGFVLKESILRAAADDRNDDLIESLKRPVMTVSESILLSDLLERLLAERQQIAIVLDEYGGTQGLVTMEDLVETLMGMEIVDETDGVEDMRQLARHQWEKRAKRLGLELESSEPSQKVEQNDQQKE